MTFMKLHYHLIGSFVINNVLKTGGEKKKVNSRNKELFMKMGKVDYRNLILDPWTYTGLVLITMVMQYSGKDMNIEGNKIFW